ncbi:MAG: TldD/PmbA family protein [Spirochaetes bacterium]|nr:TldD/PmbA family protein [Spirochaetota bacterium]MBU1078971.1 TldD/PmbA family protein [Spirochaetota bacterium]
MRYEGIARHASRFDEYAELRVQENRTMRISLLNGDVVGNARGAQSGVSARAFKNGVWGFASSPELGDGSIQAAVDRAVSNARFLGAKESAGALTQGPLPSRPGRSVMDLGTKKPRRSQKDLIDFIRAIDAYCQKYFPGLSSRSVSLSCLDMEKTLLTADGADAYSLVPRSILMVSLTVDADGEPVDLYEVYGGRGHFEDVFDDPSDLFPNIDVLADNLARKSKGVYAKPGTRDVVLDSDLAGILAHEAIGHTVEADGVLGGSVAADFMGEVVASPLVTLVDFANTALGETCPVPLWTDDEGIDARDAVLIDRGVLRSYMHNKESAAHFGVDPTGNARAYGFYDEPLIRMRNTAILPGSSKLADMIASVDDGYYLLRSSNGQADSTSEFMFGVVMGFEIKGGKLGEAIRDATISGVAFDMLKTVTAISDDMSWSCGGMCGKKQSIPVGMGGPAVRCRVNVGGRA